MSKINNSYIGKTDRTLLEQTKKHVFTADKESAVNKLLQSLCGSENITVKTNKELTELVLNSTKVIDSFNNWSSLLYKDALHIRRIKQQLNKNRLRPPPHVCGYF